MVRVTQEGMVHSALLRLQERLGSLDNAGKRLSSGKAVQVASDDVSGMNRILGLRARIRAGEQEARNAADGLTWLNVADTKLQTVSDRMHRARELIVRAGSTNDATAREALASEIESIRDDIFSVANTKIDGRALFAGTSAGPAVAAGAGYTYGGDLNDVQRRIGAEDLVTVNVNASDVFGFTDGEDLFTTLTDVATDLRSGNTQAVLGKLDDMDRAQQRLSAGLAAIGAATNHIDAAMVRNDDEQITLKGELSKVEDIDMAAAIMELQTQEVAYQATLGALSRVLQPSLVDFLR